MERIVIAMLRVDDDTAFSSIDDGPISYLEQKFERLQPSGIFLDDAFIADDDECDVWKAYINYLVNWAFDYYSEEDECRSPLSYELWLAERNYT